MFMTPSVSPIYLNNPGYSVIDVDSLNSDMGKRIKNVDWRFFQLYEYILTRVVSTSFITFDPQAVYGVEFSNALSVRKFISKMKSDGNLFGVYMASKMGYRWLF